MKSIMEISKAKINDSDEHDMTEYVTSLGTY